MPESRPEVVMIVLTSWKEPHSTFCLTMAQYCPLLGQFFAIDGRKVIRREKNFGRATTTIRNMLSDCWKRGFSREKPYSRFYSSLFTDSPEIPINTGVVRGEEWWRVCSTLHRHKCLIHKRLHYECEEWRVFSKVAFYASGVWTICELFRLFFTLLI